MKADYMAIGSSLVWDKCDYAITYSKWPHIRALQEFLIFWKVVSKYEIIHSHFMIMLTNSGWELPVLKKLGRKIVIHYRGCEIRDRQGNISLHPGLNICEECDYGAYCEKDEVVRKRRDLSSQYGDLFFVTTPDLKDFVPYAVYLPFFVPEIELSSYKNGDSPVKGEIKIVHATNHPGIEGTEKIRKAIDSLIKKGYRIDFVFLKGVPHDVVLKEIATADLTIGKMKMGYYANAQIESMLMGVPAITHIRKEFMTEELENSGFIFTDIEHIGDTIEIYINEPDKLNAKRRIARESILKLHDNKRLSGQLTACYRTIKAGQGASVSHQEHPVWRP